MKKRSATITWVTYNNFGTFLQAYALQKYIVQQGWDNYILNDSPMIKVNTSWKYEFKKALMRIFLTSFRKYEQSRERAIYMFNEFKRKHLVIDGRTCNLNKIEPEYNVFICGSDQIWNPFSLDNPNAGFYYASFTKKKKIAYAPSIGVYEVPQQYKAKLKELTNGFDFLSAREQQGVDILRELTGKEVTKVVDPTLLLDVNQWNELLPEGSPCEEKYILAYFLTPNSIFIKTVSNYAKKHGLKLKLFFTDKTYYGYDCNLITAGPIEFLHYVRNAECLFTDSFHGSIFATIFHMQFFTFRRFKETAKSQNSRVENLLEMMGVGERLLGEDDCGKVNELPDIDFERVDSNLAPFIKKSKEYLEKALK